MKNLAIWVVLAALGGACLWWVADRSHLLTEILVIEDAPSPVVVKGVVLGALGTLLLGLPVSGVLWSLVNLRSEQPDVKQGEFTELRLTAELRVALALFCLVLACAAFGSMLYIPALVAVAPVFSTFPISAEPYVQFCAALLGLVSAYAFWWLRFARLWFNEQRLYLSDYFGATRRFEFSQLTGLEASDLRLEHQILFEEGRRARVSFFFRGVEPLLRLIRAKLESRRG